ncbi:MAG: hypothetical protein ABW021_04555 [Acidimicrobiia bacterium]
MTPRRDDEMAAVGRLACPTFVSHKMGQLEIMRRRSDVECWLGAHFDIRSCSSVES